MATQIVYLTGKANWVKVDKPDPKYGHYGLDLYLDKGSMAKFEKTGCILKVRESDDGNFITLRRPSKKLVKGELVTFDPPELLQADGETPFDIKTNLIGNGSKVTCKVIFYDTQKGVGHRLEAIRVDDLVEYKKTVVDSDIDVAF
jgi:hypothetical protein